MALGLPILTLMNRIVLVKTRFYLQQKGFQAVPLFCSTDQYDPFREIERDLVSFLQICNPQTKYQPLPGSPFPR